MIYSADYARFQEPSWVNAPDDDGLTREQFFARLNKVAAKYAPLIAKDVQAETGVDASEFLAANPRFTFTDALKETLSEAAYDFAPAEAE